MDRLNALFEELKNIQASRSLPPVECWEPQREGAIDIHIDANGRWHHEGRHIQRNAIASVFATILRRDGNQYFLVTPQEKLRISVEDVPFLGIDAQVQGEDEELQVIISTNVGDHVLLSSDHPLQMRDEVPYIEVRNQLYARLTRNTFYFLVDQGVEENGIWCLYSCGSRFELGPIA